jgi:hypothetical protein
MGSSLFIVNSMLIEEFYNILKAKVLLPSVYIELLEGTASLILYKG